MNITIFDGFTSNPGDLSWKPFEDLGALTLYDRTAETELAARAAEVEIAVSNKVAWNSEALAAAPRLRMIALLSTGYNVVDLQAADERGITVCNVPAYSTPDVAQLVFGLLLEHCNRIGLHAESVRQGTWCVARDFTYSLTPQREIAGKTLGIVGMGSIGQSVARIACAFGMNVVFSNRSAKPQCESAHCRQVEFDELLQKADFITLHCPATPQTDRMIDAAAIEQMKDGAFLINTARGTLIDEQAVADALASGKLSGAAMDVVASEPMTQGNPLRTAPNTLITPHIAWATQEARERLLSVVEANIRAFQAGTPQNVVNAPKA